MRKYGWIRDLPDIRDVYAREKFPSYVAKLPVAWDVRDPDIPVLDQGDLGSCTANAIVTAFMHSQKHQGLDLFTGSRLFLYYNEREMLGTVEYDSGAIIRDGMKAINRQGLCPEEDWEYIPKRFTQRPPDHAYSHALKHQSIQYLRMYQTPRYIKMALYNGFPVIFGFMVYESIESEKVAKTGVIPFPQKKKEVALGGHAVIIVGYDDNTRLFTIQNSWGESWGDKGYGYMPYAYVLDRKLSSDFWILRTVEDGS